MKIIFLNTWQGEAGDSFEEFVREHEASTDLFCFQEVGDLLESRLRMLLPCHQFIGARREGNNGEFRQATFIGPGVIHHDSETVFAHDDQYGLGLYVQVSVNGRVFHVLNFHGMPLPGHKQDDASRINASRGIISYLQGKNGPKITGGDFNLLPDTKSIRMFEEYGYVDHIRAHAIPTTRNRLAWAKYPDNKQYHADYVFTSPDVAVSSFAVPSCEVSDHLPLFVEIDPG